MCVRVALCTPKRYTELLTLGTRKRDLIWKQGLCRCNQVKMSAEPHVGPNLIRIPIKGKCPVMTQAETRDMQLAGQAAPRTARHHQQPEGT